MATEACGFINARFAFALRISSDGVDRNDTKISINVRAGARLIKINIFFFFFSFLTTGGLKINIFVVFVYFSNTIWW